MKEIRLVITDGGQVTVHVPPDVTDVEAYGAMAICQRIMKVTMDVQIVKALNQYDDRPLVDPEEVLP